MVRIQCRLGGAIADDVETRLADLDQVSQLRVRSLRITFTGQLTVNPVVAGTSRVCRAGATAGERILTGCFARSALLSVRCRVEALERNSRSTIGVHGSACHSRRRSRDRYIEQV